MTSWKDLAQSYSDDIGKTSESDSEGVNMNREVDSQGDNNKLAEPDNSNYFEVAGMLIGIAGVAGQIILSHPWIVIRRQCQIRHDSYRFHWTPFTVLPAVIKLIRNQGLPTLWKGISSTLCFWGMGMATEGALSQICNLPKEISKHSSLKKIGQHIVLKGICQIILSPFYAASLVETVQSDLSSDPTTLVSCLLEGLRRMITFQREPVSRLLPIWKIFPMVAMYGVLHYIVKTTAGLMANNYLAPNQIELASKEEQEVQLDDRYYVYYTDLLSGVVSCCVADVVMYPVEVVVNRLCIQGTRVLIDNMDNPYEMVPVTTAYYGPTHALNTILNETEFGEGVGGLYKGFGALIIQYGLLFSMICCIRVGFEHLLVRSSTSAARSAVHSSPSNRGDVVVGGGGHRAGTKKHRRS